MLVAVLNCCSKEELEESSSEEEEPSMSAEPDPDRRKAIKNKVLVVGRLARVFALLRYVLVDPHSPLPTFNGTLQ